MDSTASSAEDRRLARGAVLLVIAFFTADAFLRTGYFYFGARADGAEPPPLDPLLSEITGSLATLTVFFAVVLPMARRFPVAGPHWRRALGAHVGGFAAFSIGKTLLMWAMRTPLWPLAGMGAYDYGTWGYRFTMEASNDVVGYALLVAAVQLFDGYKRRRDREIREARLETRLHEARLQALQGQLQPHFLFNTLNVITSVMYSDPALADRLVARLSDLLRSSLAVPDRPEVSVEEEVELLGRYVDLMKARFGDRLEVHVTVDPSARGAAIPAFLLQPLVENAIQHGVARETGPGRIWVRVEAFDGVLAVQVEDDGPGPPPESEVRASAGVGLRNTRERLRLLYGPAGTLALRARPGGGARVEVRLPMRETLVPPERNGTGAASAEPPAPVSTPTGG